MSCRASKSSTTASQPQFAKRGAILAEFGVLCAASRWFSMLRKPPMQCHNSLQFLDSRPRACSHRSLFVRRTPTRPRAKG